MKRVWIVNYYTNTPANSSNPRHYEIAKYLSSQGYGVRVFFADLNWMGGETTPIPQGERYANMVYDGLNYTHIAVPHYRGNGVQRGLSIFSFAWTIFRLRKEFEHPDVILFNIHAPFDYPIIWCVNRLKAKLIVEAWDLWPDSFVRFGLMKAGSPVVKFFYWVEKLMYSKADKIVFTLEGGSDYIKSRGWMKGFGGSIEPNKISYINNGVNLSLFNECRCKYPTKDSDLLREDIVKVLYLGSIRTVNHVKDLIDAAEVLKQNNKIKIIVIGDGPDRQVLEEYCSERALDNVIFKQKYIPLCEVADVVSHASINIMNYQKDFGQYGISSGKFFQYLAAGQPICCNIKLNYDEITRNNIGIADDLDTPEKYADAIKKLSTLKDDEINAMRERISLVAQKFDLRKLSEDMRVVIESV